MEYLINFTWNTHYTIISLFFITMAVILPLHRNYWYATYVKDNYLNLLYSRIGDCDLFFDAEYNMKSWIRTLFISPSELSLEDFVHNVQLLEDTLQIINKPDYDPNAKVE